MSKNGAEVAALSLEERRARQRAYSKKWYANPENAAKARADGRRRRAANAEKYNAKGKAWRDANPDYYRKRYEANREMFMDRAYRYYWKDPAGNIAAAQEWVRKNRDRHRVQFLARHARKRNAPGAGVTLHDWMEALALSAGVCPYCYRRKPLTMDHIEPLVSGGAHDPSNIVPACGSCNKSKGDSTLLVWLARKARRRG